MADIERLNFARKYEEDELTAEEFNRLPSKVDEIIDVLNTGGGGGDTQELRSLLGQKVGDITYEGGSLVLWDSPGGSRLGSVVLTGTVYTVRLEDGPSSVFCVLTSAQSHLLTVRPSTYSGELGQQMESFSEDYDWTIDVERDGSYVRMRAGTLQGGEDLSVDIRQWLALGQNRLRLTVAGQTSGKVKVAVYSVTLTTLSLTCQFSWWRAWVGGQASIDGLLFAGNLQKTLHARLDGREATVAFSASDAYATAPYTMDASELFPDTTGVYQLELWMEGEGGVETQHHTYQVMCVAAADAATARLACLNELPAKAVNWETQVLFAYATYNATEAVVSIAVAGGGDSWDVAAAETVDTETQHRQVYDTALEVETELVSGLTMTIEVSVGGSLAATATLTVDNSLSFAATAGADFYMRAAHRSNASGDVTVIRNESDKHTMAATYEADWEGMSWSTDGWTGGQLLVPAACAMKAKALRPLAASATASLSLEMVVRADGVADYGHPVLWAADTDNPDSDPQEAGLYLYPTRLLLRMSDGTKQELQLREESTLHLMLALQRNYGATQRNLARVFVNGVQNLVAEYAGTASLGSGLLHLGQQAADTSLRLMRLYVGTALEHRAVMANLLNAMDTGTAARRAERERNDVIDGTAISYALCKARGLNTMVIETENDDPIPSLEYTTGCRSALTLEYAGHPDWNVTLANCPTDGQGTTSMKYYRWNLRWKTDGNCTWTYADGTTATGKKGWIAGKNLHPKVNKITAKKNVASAMQGHKMGATELYDDLFQRLVAPGVDDWPDGARAAVYQHPFVGFQRHQDGTMQFIGLYTVGPDKGDKGTFGYDEEAFPAILSLEGPNHAPLGTRFLHPWDASVAYDATKKEETLKFGGEEGWDVDCAPWDSDDKDHEADILALLEEEWKPAYDLVFLCSPYLCSLQEAAVAAGMAASDADSDILDAINAAPAAFRNGSQLYGGRKNEVMQLYDQEYNLYCYRNGTQEYVLLADHDMLEYLQDYLDGETVPTTAQLRAARVARFRQEAASYWNIDSATMHEDFCVLTGASDNHAKNSYPFKLTALEDDGRWLWREDDLDTLLPTDNNGAQTKGYGVEPGDLNDEGVDVFQGSSSAFWTLLRLAFADELQAMMGRMVEALLQIAQERGLTKQYVHLTLTALLEDYFHGSSADYFPPTAYNEDAAFTYVDVWAKAPLATYNGVPPLTQAVGDQREAESRWIAMRVIYILSKYQLGGFTGSGGDGLGTLEFTAAESFALTLTPAMDLYPSCNSGGGLNLAGGRTRAGQACTDITTPSSSDTTFYIKALDWMTSVGDLCGLRLSSRGGGSDISFSVIARRLRSLKVGDEEAGNVRFNATSLAVEGQAMEDIDARNVASLTGQLSLLACPRLKKVLAQGTRLTSLLVPPGSRVTELGMPDALQVLFLHSLPLLAQEKLNIPQAALASVTALYVRDCPQLNPFGLLEQLLSASGSLLRFVTIMCTAEQEITSAQLQVLLTLARGPYSHDDPTAGYGSVAYDAERAVIQNQAGRATVEGSVSLGGAAYRSTIEGLRSYFTALAIRFTGSWYIDFEDAAVRDIVVAAWGDGTGITERQAAALSVTELPEAMFRGNTDIASFDELARFGSITSLPGYYGRNDRGAFCGCTSLRSIDLRNITRMYRGVFRGCTALEEVKNLQALTYDISSYEWFFGCTSLRSIDLSRQTFIGSLSFYGCTSLAIDVDCPLLTAQSSLIAFARSGIVAVRDLGSLQVIGGIAKHYHQACFQDCTSLRSVVLPATLLTIGQYAFCNCTALRWVKVMATTPPSLASSAFEDCGSSFLVYVPDANLADYQAADVWSGFGSRLRGLSAFAADFPGE